MAETFSLAEFVIPGTFIRVRAEGLITAGGISTGTIGIVGTASQGVDETHNLSDYEAAKATFGAYDAYADGAGSLNLTRALEVLFRNGARNVYARAVAAGANPAAFTAAFSCAESRTSSPFARSKTCTSAPPTRSRSTTALPIPLSPPVTSATRSAGACMAPILASPSRSA